MSTDLESKLCGVLGWESNSERTGELLEGLLRLGIKNFSDLQYADRKSLERLKLLTAEELELLTNKLSRMSVGDVLAEILTGTKRERIDAIHEEVTNLGIESTSDFKHLDWDTLKESTKLSDMEVKKVMRFVGTYFPEDYKEHKKRFDEKKSLGREIDLYNHRIRAEEELMEWEHKLKNDSKHIEIHHDHDDDKPLKEKRSDGRSLVFSYMEAVWRSRIHTAMLLTAVVYVTRWIPPVVIGWNQLSVTRVTVVCLYFTVDFIQFSLRLRNRNGETIDSSAGSQRLPSTLARLAWHHLVGCFCPAA